MISPDELLVRDRLPDFLIRLKIRNRISALLEPFEVVNCEERGTHLMDHITGLRDGPVSREINESRLSPPASFFEHVLGRHLKDTAGYWLPGVTDIDEADEQMLVLTCSRADLQDGQKILELGCGWGSLTLWMAARFPNARITTIAKDRQQYDHVTARLAERGIGNVIVKQLQYLDSENGGGSSFDRIVSVGLFEHVRNYQLLMDRLAVWLKPGGALFVHISAHCEYAYHHEPKGADDWMSHHFLNGGQMLSSALLLYFQGQLKIENHWQISGKHYQQSFEAWLSRMDAAREDLLPILSQTYGRENQTRWWVYWRTYFMACAEQWGYRDGEEWIVSHYLFRKPAA